ncbi:hypothetical protein O9K51_02195 [Purpureocillium lavendulum]|uniref:Secreted protein n=1 Tax=Purpureocillium lavendulum TaxID=1247861 RepID=A0AB34FY17_9HYPO|nr:hypothetical protein O9K51_02195 [Purpureocillium lavendulum]
MASAALLPAVCCSDLNDPGRTWTAWPLVVTGLRGSTAVRSHFGFMRSSESSDAAEEGPIRR